MLKLKDVISHGEVERERIAQHNEAMAADNEVMAVKIAQLQRHMDVVVAEKKVLVSEVESLSSALSDTRRDMERDREVYKEREISQAKARDDGLSVREREREGEISRLKTLFEEEIERERLEKQKKEKERDALAITCQELT